MQKLTPRVDLCFKKLFGVEENKDLLISLINSIVSNEDQVREITLLNPYNPQNFRNDKLSILDIKAIGENGQRFNIEIQITDEADYDKRALYYWAKLYTEQLKTSEDYGNLNKAIGIHILNFTSIVGTEKYHNIFNIKEKETDLPYFKDLELHTIELNKFIKHNSKEDLNDILTKVKTSLDAWITFLTRNDLLNKDNLPNPLNNQSLKKALNVLDIMNFTKEERDAYEDHRKWLMIETNTLKKYETDAKKKWLDVGIELGEKRGIELTAINMLKASIDVELISKVTGLPIEKIRELKK